MKKLRFNFLIDRRLFGILPEILLIAAVVIMPGLRNQIVMNDLKFLFPIGNVTENLRIPLLGNPLHMIFADDIQIVLILCHHKIIHMEQFHKLF